MKPQRFEIGQAVTVKPGIHWVKVMGDITWWRRILFFPILQKIFPALGVPVGEILYVKHYGRSTIFCPDEWFLQFTNYESTDWYAERCFDPVEMTSEEVAALLEESMTQTVEK